jgi:hypothetical protein
MIEERELLKKILATRWLDHELSCEVEAIFAQPEQEQEPVAWIDDGSLKNLQESTGYALRYLTNDTENLKNTDVPLYLAPQKRKQDNIQYLLDQVAKLTAENAMLKEKWSTPKPEQQPEAWIIVNKETGYRTQVSDLTPFLYHREIFEVIPLYTAPPKREPLSDKEITKNTPKLIHIGERLAFHAGVRFAEKHHGIGGEE